MKKRLYLNDQNTILVVTGRRDLELHLQKLLKSISRKQKIFALVENVRGKKINIDSRRLVIARILSPNNPLSLFSIFKYLWKYDKIETVLFQLDLNKSSKLLANLALPVVLLLLKFSSKRVFFELNPKKTGQSPLLVPFYKAIAFLSDEIIVISRGRIKYQAL